MNKFRSIMDFFFGTGKPLGPAFSGESYVVLDFETWGLKPDSPIWQAATFDSQTRQTRDWDVKPFSGKTSVGSQLGHNKPKAMEAWTWERYKDSPTYQAAMDKSRSGVHPRTFIRELFESLKGRNVLIANARFESRAVAGPLKLWGDLESTSRQFETAPAGSKAAGHVFYVTGKKMQALRGAGLGTGHWGSLVAATAEESNLGFTKVRDIQDYARAFFSKAESHGMLSSIKSSYTGTAINILGMAYKLGRETHLAGDDVKQEAALFEKIWSGLQAQHEIDRGFIPAAKALFGNSEHFLALKRLNAARPELKRESILRSLADAKLNWRKTDYDIVESFKRINVPMWDQGVLSRGEITIPIKRKPKSFNEAASWLLQDRFTGGLDLDKDQLVKHVNSLDRNELESLVHTGVGVKDAETRNVCLENLMGKAKWRFTDALGTLIKHYPKESSVTGAIGLTGLTALNMLLAPDKNDRLVVDGLDERGIAAELRKTNTQFGSGWQGIIDSIWFSNIESESELQSKYARWKRTVWQNNARKLLEERELKAKELESQKATAMLNPGEGVTLTPEQVQTMQKEGLLAGSNRQIQKNLTIVDISPDKYDYEIDDADTLVLRKKTLFGFGRGKPISIRLAGIDAPEVGSHTDDPLAAIRIGEEQPGGQTARAKLQSIIDSQQKLTVAYDPEASTYGRHIGMLYGDDGSNINLSLVKSGSVAYLPFGDAGSQIISSREFEAAERFAYEQTIGMWQEPFWQTYHAASDVAGTRITFNTLTRMDKLVKDPGLEDLFFSMWSNQENSFGQEEREDAYETGEQLKKTYGRFNRFNKGKRKGTSGRPKSNTEGVNGFDGLQHGGIASQNRRAYGFGSPWQGISRLSKEWLEQLKLPRVGTYLVDSQRLYNELYQQKTNTFGFSGAVSDIKNDLQRLPLEKAGRRSEVINAVTETKKTGLGRMSFIGPNALKDSITLYETAKHEATHTFLHPAFEEGLSITSAASIERVISKKNRWFFNRKQALEELVAYRYEGFYGPSSSTSYKEVQESLLKDFEQVFRQPDDIFNQISNVTQLTYDLVKTNIKAVNQTGKVLQLGDYDTSAVQNFVESALQLRSSFDGFQHGGVAAEMRKQYGFGSPYLGTIPDTVLAVLRGNKTWKLFKELGSGVMGKGFLAQADDSTWGVVKKFEASEDYAPTLRNIIKDEKAGQIYIPPMNGAFSASIDDVINLHGQNNAMNILRGNNKIRKDMKEYVTSVKSKRPGISVFSPEWERYSHQVARQRLGDFVPESYELMKPFQSGSGPMIYHAQEYAGISLREAVNERLLDKDTWTRQIHDIIDRSESANLFHLDLHVNNIVWDPVKQQIRPIDWSAHIVNPSQQARERIMQQHNDLIGKIFNSGQHQKIRQKTQVASQHAASKSLFTSPIGHHRGGS